MSLYASVYKHLLFPLYEQGVRRRSTLRYVSCLDKSQWLSPQELSVVQVVGQEMGRPMYVVALCRDEHVFEIARSVLILGFRERFKAALSDLVGARRVNSILRALRWKGGY